MTAKHKRKTPTRSELKKLKDEAEKARQERSAHQEDVFRLKQHAGRLRNQIKKLEVKHERVHEQFQKLFSTNKLTNRSVKLSSGNFAIASTFRLQPSDHVFLLEVVNTIIYRFQQSHKATIVAVVNRALLMRLFGTLSRALDYANAKFVVSDGVADDTLIVLTQTYAP